MGGGGVVKGGWDKADPLNLDLGQRLNLDVLIVLADRVELIFSAKEKKKKNIQLLCVALQTSDIKDNGVCCNRLCVWLEVCLDVAALFPKIYFLNVCKIILQ